MGRVVGVPLGISELDLKPEWTKPLELSDEMQQTLALLTGFWKNQRVLLKASPSGILFIANPPIKDIFHVTATTGNYIYQGSNIECSEVLVMAHPDNTGRIWTRANSIATAANAIPLDAGDSFSFNITNLTKLFVTIVTNGEIAIVLYSI
jgi:hypothetical protein